MQKQIDQVRRAQQLLDLTRQELLDMKGLPLSAEERTTIGSALWILGEAAGNLAVVDMHLCRARQLTLDLVPRQVRLDVVAAAMDPGLDYTPVNPPPPAVTGCLPRPG